VLQNFITLGKRNRFKIYEKRGDEEKEEEKMFFKQKCGLGDQLDH
jgi:hypothetical protein